MRYKRVLAAVAKESGSVKQIAERLDREEIGVSIELHALYAAGKLTRAKGKPPGAKRHVYVYSLAETPAPLLA